MKSRHASRDQGVITVGSRSQAWVRTIGGRLHIEHPAGPTSVRSITTTPFPGLHWPGTAIGKVRGTCLLLCFKWSKSFPIEAISAIRERSVLPETIILIGYHSFYKLQ